MGQHFERKSDLQFLTGSMLPLRSMRPTQPEYGSADLYLQGSPESKSKEMAQKSGNLPRVVLWTRLPGVNILHAHFFCKVFCAAIL